MRVKELADKLGVSVDTVRYYTRIGYLKPLCELDNNYRDYGLNEERHLRFILNARQLGFSVEDIGELIRHANKGQSPCTAARDLIAQRLKETERRFEEMRALRQRMHDAVNSWQEKPDLEPTGDVICHLIEDFIAKGDVKSKQ